MARKKKDDIKIKESNEGKFTAWAKKNMPGKSVCAAASAVMKSKTKYKILGNSNSAISKIRPVDGLGKFLLYNV